MSTNTFYYTDRADFPQSTFAHSAYYNRDDRLLVIIGYGANLLYSEVPNASWETFADADSPGLAFGSLIKGVFPYEGTVSYDFYEEVTEDESEPVVAASGSEYTVSATFATYEEAEVIFSYAKDAAKHASITAYNNVGGN